MKTNIISSMLVCVAFSSCISMDAQNTIVPSKNYYWCPLKVTSIIPMCPLCYQISILDTFSKSKPLNQKALVPVVPIHYF